jgi:hypothetical protein
MTHETREECEAHPTTRLWIEWAERHGFAWRAARRHYYNLPSRSRMASYDDDPTESRIHWELQIEADPAVERPDDLYMIAGRTLDQAIDLSRERRRKHLEATRSAQATAEAELVAHRTAILAAYGRIKRYPRDDEYYRWTCLAGAIQDAIPGTAAAWSVSESSTPEIRQAVRSALGLS